MNLPQSVRIVWNDRAALALGPEDIRLLIDFAGPKFLQALSQLHEYNEVDHKRLIAQLDEQQLLDALGVNRWGERLTG